MLRSNARLAQSVAQLQVPHPRLPPRPRHPPEARESEVIETNERPRAEHLEWCKQRAREYLARGDAQNAITSMASDLEKHSAWRGKPVVGMLMLAAAMDGSMTAARRYVEGFN